MGSGSSIIENLQSQLKLREGEISHLQVSFQKAWSVVGEFCEPAQLCRDEHKKEWLVPFLFWQGAIQKTCLSEK